MKTADLVLVPVHENGAHWCLLVIDIPERCIEYYDRCLSMLLQLVRVAGTRSKTRVACSMVGRSGFYDEQRVRRLIDLLFGWLVFEAHDKGCVAHVFGPSMSPGGHNAASRGGAQPVHEDGAAAGGRAGHDSVADALSDALGGLRLVQEGSPEARCGAREVAAKRQGNCQAAVAIPHDDSSSIQDVVDHSGWRCCLLDSLPQQHDECSCGVFMAAFADLVMRGCKPPFVFGQADMRDLRMGMAAALLGMHACDKEASLAPD